MLKGSSFFSSDQDYKVASYLDMLEIELHYGISRNDKTYQGGAVFLTFLVP